MNDSSVIVKECSGVTPFVLLVHTAYGSQTFKTAILHLTSRKIPRPIPIFYISTSAGWDLGICTPFMAPGEISAR